MKWRCFRSLSLPTEQWRQPTRLHPRPLRRSSTRHRRLRSPPRSRPRHRHRPRPPQPYFLRLHQHPPPSPAARACPCPCSSRRPATRPARHRRRLPDATRARARACATATVLRPRKPRLPQIPPRSPAPELPPWPVLRTTPSHLKRTPFPLPPAQQIPLQPTERRSVGQFGSLELERSMGRRTANRVGAQSMEGQLYGLHHPQ
jgi:hypothetical protein